MAEIQIFLRHDPVSTSTALRSASTPKQELEGSIKISAIGRCDLVVAAAA